MERSTYILLDKTEIELLLDLWEIGGGEATDPAAL